MLRFPQAKINLGLYVTERRQDGYHNLESIFVHVPLTDALELDPSAEKTRMLSYGAAVPGDPADNLCFKTWKLLHQAHGIAPVDIHLVKRIPTGAGLGGGSADASATLLALNDLFHLNLDQPLLNQYAARLGSDCSFFLRNSPQLVTGTGTEMEPISLNLSGWHISIVHPGIHISTPEAYKAIQPKPAPENWVERLTNTAPESWRSWLSNDFERGAFARFPILQDIKNSLYHKGATYASMSGSGSALFALSKHPISFSEELEGCFTWQGKW